jgi:hypothetical protein
MTVSEFAEHQAARASARRAAIQRIEETDDGRSTTVTVTLAWEGSTFTGQAMAASGDARRTALTAHATLEAVERMTEGRTDFRLVDVAEAEAGGVDIAIAVIADPGVPDHPLVGSAFRNAADPLAATTAAVLDAINRRATLSL